MSDYPYIQTIRDIDEDLISRYAIQPVGEVGGTPFPEENPLMAFGPLGRVNIFVGATNSGKSQFLRGLARCSGFGLYKATHIEHMRSASTLCEWLAKSEGHFRFNFPLSPVPSGSSLPRYAAQLPYWMRNILISVGDIKTFSGSYDAQKFSEICTGLRPFFAEHYEIRANFQDSAHPYFYDIKSAEILQQEIESQKSDIGKNPTFEQIESLVNKLKRWQEDYQIDVSPDKEWNLKFIYFWVLIKEIKESVPPQLEEPNRFYIPTLRSPVGILDEQKTRLQPDLFEITTRENYNLPKELVIFTGSQLYEKLLADRNGTTTVMKGLQAFEKFLSDSFFSGRDVLIVALDPKHNADKKHIEVRVNGEADREVHQLGDGIGTLIVLMYQIFTAPENSWIFIEEPEVHLHPGLQRVFLETLVQNKTIEEKKLKIFFTTHSNHLVGLALRDGTLEEGDISVFAFQKRVQEKPDDQEKFLIRPLVSEHHHALTLLGVQNASVLMAQCGIWVEGVTDRKYIRAYLQAFMKSLEWEQSANKMTLREDIHFAFWEYAGSNLAHYLFEEENEDAHKVAEDIRASALCNRIFLVADRDTTTDEGEDKKSKRRIELRALSDKLGNFQFFLTPGREIENLLSAEQLQACLPALFGSAKKPKDVPPVAFDDGDFKDVGIGKFLKERYDATCPDALPYKNSKGELGTLSNDYKNKLADEATKHIMWDSMSDGAKKLARELYEFLKEHNSI